VMDELETLALIRTNEGCGALLVEMVTDSPEADLEQKVKEAGGNTVFRKPVSMDVLAEEINRLVKSP